MGVGGLNKPQDLGRQPYCLNAFACPMWHTNTRLENTPWRQALEETLYISQATFEGKKTVIIII